MDQQTYTLTWEEIPHEMSKNLKLKVLIVATPYFTRYFTVNPKPPKNMQLEEPWW